MKKIDIINYIQFGSSEKSNKKAISDSILADSVEALLGAIYIDGGLNKSKKIILSLWDEYLTNEETLNAKVSVKNILQWNIKIRLLPWKITT